MRIAILPGICRIGQIIDRGKLYRVTASEQLRVSFLVRPKTNEFARSLSLRQSYECRMFPSAAETCDNIIRQILVDQFDVNSQLKA